MAGDWIKFECATPDKPEVWAIAAALDIDPDAVVGKLLRVWGWFDQQTEEGNAPSVSKLLLDRLVGVTGFCKTVIECGWMEDNGKHLTLPHFDRHNGKTAKTRALTAKRVAQHKAKVNDNTNDSLTQGALPKEEKRREDIKKNTSSKPLVTFSSWINSLKDLNVPAIEENDPIFDYALEAGIPSDYLRITWLEFKAEFMAKDKKQKDWRAHFRNFVRKNYYALWWIEKGEYKLTTRGQQAMAAMNNKKGEQQ